MNERNRLLKPDEEQKAEAAWVAGNRGTSPHVQEAAQARCDAEEALEAAREQLQEKPLWGQAEVLALNEIASLERRLSEAILVWQVRYLESEERQQQLGKLLNEAERQAMEER
jgi:hypothetical protein